MCLIFNFPELIKTGRSGYLSKKAAMPKPILPVLLILLLFPLFGLAQQDPIDSANHLARNAAQPEQVAIYSDLAIFLFNSNPDTALYFAEKARDIAEQSGNNDAKMKADYTMGRLLALKGHYHLSIKHFDLMRELSQKEKNDSITAVALNGTAVSLWHLGKHAESLEKFFTALRIREMLQDIKGTAMTKANIGMVYQSQGKAELAEKYVNESLILFKSVPDIDPALHLQTMHTLADIYGIQGKIKESLLIDQEGLALAEKTNNELAKSMFFDNMGNGYANSTPPDYEKAIEYFRRTLLIDSSFENKKQMSDSYLNLGTVFLQQKKFSEAITHLQRSIDLTNESSYTQGKFEALQYLSSAYHESGQNEKAYLTLQQAMLIKDSLVNTSSEERIAEMETLYDTEKNRQQIRLQREQLSKKNYILIGAVLLMIALVWLLLSYYTKHRLKQKSRLQQEIMRQQEIATKAVLTAEEDERKRIARDLHDGVGQMMSAAKMNLSAFESDINLMNTQHQASLSKIISLVDESCKEIRSFSHKMIPNALLESNLGLAVRDFVDKIDKKSLQVHLYTENMEERMGSNMETILYRIIQECVNNVIKHADATKLDISIIKDEKLLTVTIEDNGKGFDPMNKDRFQGIGLKNIHTRVEYLKGTIDIDSAPGRGTVISLLVPLEEKAVV